MKSIKVAAIVDSWVGKPQEEWPKTKEPRAVWAEFGAKEESARGAHGVRSITNILAFLI
jgi:hypothetical protein